MDQYVLTGLAFLSVSVGALLTDRLRTRPWDRRLAIASLAVTGLVFAVAALQWVFDEEKAWAFVTLGVGVILLWQSARPLLRPSSED